MRELKDLLNQIGNFHFQSGKERIDFIGTLVNQDNHVIIQARIEKKNLDRMKHHFKFGVRLVGPMLHYLIIILLQPLTTSIQVV